MVQLYFQYWWQIWWSLVRTLVSGWTQIDCDNWKTRFVDNVLEQSSPRLSFTDASNHWSFLNQYNQPDLRQHLVRRLRCRWSIQPNCASQYKIENKKRWVDTEFAYYDIILHITKRAGEELKRWMKHKVNRQGWEKWSSRALKHHFWGLCQHIILSNYVEEGIVRQAGWRKYQADRHSDYGDYVYRLDRRLEFTQFFRCWTE